jgi:hypothetical protein
VVEDVASTLNTLVQPLGTMTLFVDSNGKGLASAVIYRIDESNIKLVRVFRKMVSTRHSYLMSITTHFQIGRQHTSRPSSHNKHLLLSILVTACHIRGWQNRLSVV